MVFASIVVRLPSCTSLSYQGFAVLLLLLIQVQAALSRINQCGDFVDLGSEPLGVISSPGYPDSYTNLMNCIWLIQAPTGHAVSLYIDPVLGEGADNGYINITSCKDYLEVRDGNSTSNLLFHACNTTETVHITSSNRWMWVQFKADQFNNPGKGFSAIFARTQSNATAIASLIPECQTINFRCRNKQCVTWAYRCDAFNDCGCTGSNCDEGDCGGLDFTKEIRVGIGVGIGTFIFLVVFLTIGLMDLYQKARQVAENARLLEEEKARGRRRGKPAASIAMTVQQAANQNNSNVNLETVVESET